MGSKLVLLMTACINPQGMSKTVLQNKEERLTQYKTALNWYLRNTFYHQNNDRHQK